MPVDILKLPNFSDANLVSTDEVAADIAAGQNQATLVNASQYSQYDFIAFNPGLETGEFFQVNSVAGEIVTMLTNFLIAHKKRERVLKLYGNKINVYQAANVDGTVPLDTAFTVVKTVVIVPQQSYTIATINNGGQGFWYKATFYNDANQAETPLSSSDGVRGGGYGDLVSVEDVRTEAGLKPDDKRLSDVQVAKRRNHAQSEVKGTLAGVGYTMPLQTQNGAYYIPDEVENIVRILAAGYILSQDFGTTTATSSKSGKAKLDMAYLLLEKIGKRSVVLLDANEQPMAMKSLVSGYPDDTTTTGGPNGSLPEPSVAAMNKVF
jgi:hypothetical protein